jgi:hypothetical protein
MHLTNFDQVKNKMLLRCLKMYLHICTKSVSGSRDQNKSYTKTPTPQLVWSKTRMGNHICIRENFTNVEPFVMNEHTLHVWTLFDLQSPTPSIQVVGRFKFFRCIDINMH